MGFEPTTLRSRVKCPTNELNKTGTKFSNIVFFFLAGISEY